MARRTELLLVAWALAASGALARGVGCQVYDVSLLDPPADAGTTAKNGVGWWSRADSDGCFSAGVPRPEDRPPPSAAPNVEPIFMAVASMRIGSLDENGTLDPNAWQSIGFDLDGTCTGSDTCPRTGDPRVSCVPSSAQVARDGQFCRDNTFGRLEYTAQLVPELAKKYGLNDDAFNCALCTGQYNFLLKITGYNGLPDDDQVRVDLYPSPGLEKPLPWNCALPDWKTHPCFTPDLPWTLRADSVLGSTSGVDVGPSKLFDDSAYVREGYLVVRLPEDTLFWFPGTKALAVAYPLALQKGIVTGRIVKGPDGVYRIEDGIIAGRAKKDDMLRGFRLIGFCEDDANFPLMEQFISSNLDTLSDGTTDPARPCDSMSVGLAFTGLQAKPGKLEAVQPLVECGGKLVDGGADASADAGADAPSDAADQ